MATVEERNYNAVQSMVTSLKLTGGYNLDTAAYDDSNREYDALLTFNNGTTVLVMCMNEGLDVEISPPQNVGFLFDDELKPMLLKENKGEFRFKRLQMKLNSDVVIDSASMPPADRIYLKQHGAYDRLDVFLLGSTCLPRLKLLLERICRGR